MKLKEGIYTAGILDIRRQVVPSLVYEVTLDLIGVSAKALTKSNALFVNDLKPMDVAPRDEEGMWVIESVSVWIDARGVVTDMVFPGTEYEISEEAFYKLCQRAKYLGMTGGWV